MNRKLCLGIAAAVVALGVGGTAMAQFPEGVKSGSGVTPGQTSRALATLAIPAVVGLNVGHNFVLDFSSATQCAGTTSTQTTFPQSPTVNTTYTFAVSTAQIASSANVACPGSGSQPDVATVQVFSTLGANSRLRAQISDGGVGAQATTFAGLIPDIFTGNRLTLLITAGDSCGTGAAKTSPFVLQTAPADQVTGIPKTGWVNCTQKLQLTLNPATAVNSGTATGTLTYTMVSP